jgi:Tfp pilus assembly protein PilF
VAVLLVAYGCKGGEEEQKTLPPNSPTQSVEAAEAFNQGNKLRQTDKPGAIAAYTRAIKADPKFQFAYYNRALTLAEEFRIAEARTDLDTLKAMKSARAQTLESLIAVAEDLASKPSSQPSASRPTQ